jgi:hypothetical protein
MASGIINTVGLRPQIVHRARGTAGQSGYVKICRIVVQRTYANAPLRFAISQRARPIAQISIVFANENNTDPPILYFIYDCPQEDLVSTAFLYKVSASTWDLYIQKLESYDEFDIVSFDVSLYQQGNSFAITWTDVQENTALSWTHSATKGYQFIREFAITPTSLVGSVGTYNYVGKIGRIAICCFNLYLQPTSSAGSIYLTDLPIPIKNVGFAMVGNNNGRRFRIDPSGRMMNDDPTVTESWYNGSITYITAS